MHVIQNSKEIGVNAEKMVLAGDSAGGGIVAAITQRLLEENQPQPRLQVLIYPWIQLVNSKLPS